MEKEQKKTNVEQMQDAILALASQRDSAINRLSDPKLSREEVVGLCKYVVFIQAQIHDLLERQSLAKLLDK